MSCLRPGGLDLTKRLLQGADLPSGSLVADLGCGSGETMAYLRSQGHEALGLDLVLPPGGAGQIGDIRDLPWADQSLDGVMAECSLSVCGDRRLALLECYRVLKPGGRLMISDVFFEQGADWENWRQVVQQAGFRVMEMVDVSSLWRGFVAQCLWADWDPVSFWCGDGLIAGRGKVGYFVLWAVADRVFLK